MFKHVHYPKCRRSLASEDGSNKSSAGSSMNHSLSDAGSSRSSSALSGNELQTGTIKVFCKILRPDIDYKTLVISSDDTSKDVVQMLLRKCKMRNRDPNLYYLNMDISTQRHSGQALETTLVLDDESRPLELKTCQPQNYCVQFTMRSKKGGLLKVHDNCLNTSSQYKSLLISQQTSSSEVIQLLLTCHDSPESADNFALFEVCHKPFYNEHKLFSQDMPLLLREKWSEEGSELHLRRITPLVASAAPHVFSATELLPWTLDSKQQSALLEAIALDALSHLERPETPCEIRNSCNDYMNYVYI